MLIIYLNKFKLRATSGAVLFAGVDGRLRGKVVVCKGFEFCLQSNEKHRRNTDACKLF
jgi:hypothetical protein